MSPAIFLKNAGVQPRPQWPWLRLLTGDECQRITIRGSRDLDGDFVITHAVVYPRDRQSHAKVTPVADGPAKLSGKIGNHDE